MKYLLALLAGGAALLAWIAAGFVGGAPGYLLWSATEDREPLALRALHGLGLMVMLAGWCAGEFVVYYLAFG